LELIVTPVITEALAMEALPKAIIAISGINNLSAPCAAALTHVLPLYVHCGDAE
jgi:hypothetical protein